MIYFITKVVFKKYSDSELLTKHKTIMHTYSLEEAIELVKSKAFEYVVKKNRKLFDKTTHGIESDKRTNTYTMKCHPLNKHIIEVFKTFQLTKASWWAEAESKEDKVGYFCYTLYDGNLTEDDVEPIVEPNKPRNVPIIRNNEQHGKVIQELTRNNLFLKKRTKLDKVVKEDLNDLDTFISGLTILNN